MTWWRRVCDVLLGRNWPGRRPTYRPLAVEETDGDARGLPRGYACAVCLDGDAICETCDDCDQRHCTRCDPCRETKGEPMATKPKAKKLPARVWLHVTPRGTGKGREWAVLRNSHAKGVRGAVVTVERTQNAAVAYARLEGRALWKAGTPAQVVVHSATGRIRADATFGADPARSRG